MRKEFLVAALLGAAAARGQGGGAARQTPVARQAPAGQQMPAAQQAPAAQQMPAAQAAEAPVEKLSLEEAVKRAIRRSPTAEIAQDEIARAEGILREVRAPSLPTLFGNAVYTRLDSDRTTTRDGKPQIVVPKDLLNANLALSVPLIAPQRWSQWSHASENVEISRAAAEEVRRNIGVATARAWLAVVAQHRLAGVNQQSVANAREHLEYAKARLEAGSGNRLDVVRGGQEAATAAAGVANALTGLSRAMEALGVLVANDLPVDTTEQVTLPAPPSPQDAVHEAEQQRVDVRASRSRLAAAEHVVRDDYADYLPLLTANFQPFVSTSPTLTTPSTGWQASLVLSVPFYDGGARYGQQRERAALAAEARVQLDGLLRQARSEVRTAFESVRRSDEALQAAQEASRLARDALEMTQLAYREGATNDLEVVDAERRARDADTAALVSEDAARQARIDLLTASGRFP